MQVRRGAVPTCESGRALQSPEQRAGAVLPERAAAHGCRAGDGQRWCRGSALCSGGVRLRHERPLLLDGQRGVLDAACSANTVRISLNTLHMLRKPSCQLVHTGKYCPGDKQAVQSQGWQLTRQA